ncbi:hypothetical protein BDB00DRAFT_787310 [Zychaea mexicana]|uniref:uncharacterized protein n=1 Tax=Zychaea mexicana TaxID=64656 RepID=UPI0022FDB805|nr:uncharacterized protein BDB00DRAFT_787310 [Zychaea mexicana]KAI9494268.1 hypothetical protein BDB00DRAFT_787310 [Zychaea mexicana]
MGCNDRATVLDAVAKQLPGDGPLGVELRFKDTRVVVEITPRNEQQRNILETEGLIVRNYRIISTPALRKGSGLLTINLYNLPHAPVEDLSVAIQRMLAPYGRILDISIFLSRKTGFPLGGWGVKSNAFLNVKSVKYLA